MTQINPHIFLYSLTVNELCIVSDLLEFHVRCYTWLILMQRSGVTKPIKSKGDHRTKNKSEIIYGHQRSRPYYYLLLPVTSKAFVFDKPLL